MVSLLIAIDRHRPSPYVTRLRAALTREAAGLSAGSTGATEPRPHGLIEPLSSRERDVLRLLDTELNGPEIARELVVSLNTVRTHTKNLYMKLGVTSRRAAVARAKELDLL
jgi:LuxR family maltose regulon positive regulatory protein